MPGLNRVEIIYDGLCPVCDAYFRFQQLTRNGISARLIDARQHPDMVASFARRGIDLNRDFVLRVGDAEHVGGEAMFVLAALGTTNTIARKINAVVFRSRVVSLLLYRSMRAGRHLLLFCLGRPLIQSSFNHPQP